MVQLRNNRFQRSITVRQVQISEKILALMEKDLYIALNGGALKYNGNETVNYKVEAYAKNDLNEYGLPKEGTTALATSSVYNVTGYYEVQNGSFETPTVTKLHSGTNNWQFSNENYKKLGGVWQTTGTHAADPRWSDPEGADIEIVTTLGPSLNVRMTEIDIIGMEMR